MIGEYLAKLYILIIALWLVSPPPYRIVVWFGAFLIIGWFCQPKKDLSLEEK